MNSSLINTLLATIIAAIIPFLFILVIIFPKHVKIKSLFITLTTFFIYLSTLKFVFDFNIPDFAFSTCCLIAGGCTGGLISIITIAVLVCFKSENKEHIRTYNKLILGLFLLFIIVFPVYLFIISDHFFANKEHKRIAIKTFAAKICIIPPAKGTMYKYLTSDIIQTCSIFNIECQTKAIKPNELAIKYSSTTPDKFLTLNLYNYYMNTQKYDEALKIKEKYFIKENNTP